MELPDEPTAGRPRTSDADRQRRRRRRRLPPLSTAARVLLIVVGWLVVAAGVAMLAVPGPGLLTMLMGAALLSLVSVRIHAALRRLFARWPRAWRRVQRFRKKVHDRLSRKP